MVELLHIPGSNLFQRSHINKSNFWITTQLIFEIFISKFMCDPLLLQDLRFMTKLVVGLQPFNYN